MLQYFVLIGKRASGKDALSDYAQKSYNIPSIRFSTVLAQLGLELGIIKPDELKEKSKLQTLGNTIRKDYGGEEFYTKKLAEKIKGKTYIINGARHPKEISCLKKIFADNLITVGIISDDSLRFKRTKKQGIIKCAKIYNFWAHRKSIDFRVTKKEFNILESNPAEQNIDLLLEKVDYKINNNTTLKDFHKKIDKLFSKLKLNVKKITYSY